MFISNEPNPSAFQSIDPFVSNCEMASSNKGFKYAKGKKVEDPEELSYDDVEEVRRGSGSKRKGSQNDISVGSKKSRSSAASARSSNASITSSKSNNNSKSRTQTIQKHHYPASSCEPSTELLNSVKRNSRHRAVLRDMVDEIASSERQAIQSYAQSELSKTLKGKKHIMESLDVVLEQLATDVHSLCPPEMVFEPELSKSERSELKPLLETKRLLEQHSQKLDLFESDISQLAKEYDVWLGSEVVISKLEHATQGEAAQSAEMETMRQYKELLQALEHHCDQILSSSDSAEAAIAQAQQAKDKLYLVFNKARELATHGSSKVPRDAKDLLKKMPAFL